MSDRFSRGEIISLLAIVPGAVAATASVASAADTDQAKTIKKSLAYVDKSTKSGQTCSNCRFFKAGTGGSGTCQIIPGGTVKAAGWCKSWAKKS